VRKIVPLGWSALGDGHHIPAAVVAAAAAAASLVVIIEAVEISGGGHRGEHPPSK
jgi:hypothetical protein